jgi:hypothetical protein
MKLLRSLLLVALVLGLVSTKTEAQSATIQVTATVQKAIAVTSGRDLAFGTVLAGTPLTVFPHIANAGRWDITGEGDLPVSLQFTLPTQLTGTGAPVPIGDWSAIFSGTVAGDGTLPFIAVSGQAYSYSLMGGMLHVFLGATITPPAASTGSYSGTAVLTVNYL